MKTLQNKSLSSSRLWVFAVVGTLLIATITIIFVVSQPFGSNKDTAHHSQTENATTKLASQTMTELSEPQSPYPPRQTRSAWYGLSDNEIESIKESSTYPPETEYVKLTGEYDKWLLGTPVEVLIPHIPETFEALVERIKPNGFGSTTIYAGPANQEDVFEQLIITYSATGALAQVQTTAGSYEMSQLVGSDDIAGIIPSEVLHNNQDFTLEDTGKALRDRHSDAIYVPRREE
ncbi:MAG: hypothetical protein F4039_09965 [Gammaproteobacteria bacterium]|nr:hypothetical protein [Gammaproteobacteria bacterium]MXX95832.1 hypothetical protein [Gammaproteobacteria bacterium]MYK44396.1 hypothetical protein [Gammaproteobacteria bacterium]